MRALLAHPRASRAPLAAVLHASPRRQALRGDAQWQWQVRVRGLSEAATKGQDERGGTAEGMSSGDKFRVLWRQYGLVFFGTYISVYLTTLGTLYELLQMDVISAKGAVDLLVYLGLDNHVDVTKLTSKAGNFAIAWILTKPTEPVRLVLASMLTPRVARFVGRAPPKVPKGPSSSSSSSSASALPGHARSDPAPAQSQSGSGV